MCAYVCVFISFLVHYVHACVCCFMCVPAHVCLQVHICMHNCIKGRSIYEKEQAAFEFYQFKDPCAIVSAAWL